MAGQVMARLLEKVAAVIERSTWLDAPADLLATTVPALHRRRWLLNLLSGTPIGHPVHPLLVAIPIGAWSSAALFDVLGDEKGARRLVGIGVLSALPATATGLSNWSWTTGAERRIGVVHAASNAVAITAYALSWVARLRGDKISGLAWSAAGVSALGVGGWLGGHLSYALGVGVDTTAFQTGSQEWVAVGRPEVVPGTLTGVDADGVPVVLFRDEANQVVALSDRCSHLGAPLHEGELRNGCLVCPWHGSEFAADGGVANGPAARPQPRWEVSERDGDVFVRRSDEARGLRTHPVGR